MASAVLAGVAVPATAGGWWSYPRFDGRDYGVGEKLVVTSEAFFTTVEDAETAGQVPWFAYLVSDYDRGLLAQAMGRDLPTRWWSVPESATVARVGRLQRIAMDTNVGHAVASGRIPDVPPGRYFLMLCDEGCRRPFAHVVPSQRVTITPDPVAARAARRAEAIAERTSTQLSVLRDQLRSARRETASALSAVAAMRDAQRVLELSSSEGTPPRFDWPALAWAFVAGMALAALLVGGGALWARRVGRRRAIREEQERWRPARPREREFESAIR